MKPTNNIRILKRKLSRRDYSSDEVTDTCHQVVEVLQQEWSDGTKSEWRDVTIITEV